MRAVVTVVTMTLLLALPARADRGDWTSSAACGVCHVREFAAWQATPHAQTGGRLPARPSSRCLVCHATGEAPAGVTIELGVGCESCHGAGAHYADADLMLDGELARALGMTALSTPSDQLATCQRCHLAGLRQDAAALAAAVRTIHLVAPTAAQAVPRSH